MSGGAGPLVPTFHGFVHNSMDGLVLFEACLSGKLHHVPRRPHDRERSSLIKSGSIFIYEENASGIKRWTDGVAWSPSRILGNFLIYRELEKPFPPGEKKRAMKRKRTSMPGEPYPRRDSDDAEGSQELSAPLTPPTPNVGGEVKPEVPSTDQDKELERSLIGSLVDSYGFRPDGLVKKTMSISINGISHHMVSYYKVDDVKNNILPRPLSDTRLTGISVRPELYLKQNFRAPVEETEHYAVDGHMHAHPQMMYSTMNGGYAVPSGQYYRGQPYPGMYGIGAPQTSSSGMYSGMSGASWPGQQASAGAMPYGHQSYASQPYGSSYYKPTEQANGSSVKTEAQQPSSHYGTQYGSTYGGIPQRSVSQSTPSMMQPPYQQTPQQQAPSTFAQMTTGSQRSSYGGAIDSPSASAQQQSVYGNPSNQSYAVRSPTSQSYGIQSAPQSAVTQSPHSTAKSPQTTHAGTPASTTDPSLHNTGMSYRSSHPSSDGLGISNTTSSYSAPQNGHSYSYGNSTPQSAGPGPYP